MWSDQDNMIVSMPAAAAANRVSEIVEFCTSGLVDSLSRCSLVRHYKASTRIGLARSEMVGQEADQSDQGSLMAESDKVFAGSIPMLYDTLMVPLIFEAYATGMAELVAASSPDSVLETAAGSGVVTRALAPKLRADARYMVTDLSQPMLDYAATRQGSDRRIEWLKADALDLPFGDASFDVVCCQFGAMFFPNRVAGYVEARRVLRPGGRFVFSVWDRIEENVFAHEVTNAVAAVFPDDPPRFLARTPHGYYDIALIRDELNQAGFSNIQIETHDELSHAPSARDVATAYCQGTPLRNEILARDANLLQVATDRATEAIASRHGEGWVAGKIQAHVIVATVATNISQE